jgi:hypothetical protein
MAALVPAIHVFVFCAQDVMPATSAGMTIKLFQHSIDTGLSTSGFGQP